MAGKYRKMTATRTGKPGAQVRKAMAAMEAWLRRSGYQIAKDGHGPGCVVFCNPGRPKDVCMMWVNEGERFTQDADGKFTVRPDAPGNWQRATDGRDGWVLCDDTGQPMRIPARVAQEFGAGPDGAISPADLAEGTALIMQWAESQRH